MWGCGGGWVRDAAENAGAQPQLLLEAKHAEWLQLCRDRQMLHSRLMLHSRALVHKCSVHRTPKLKDSAKLMFFGYASLGTPKAGYTDAPAPL